MPRYKEIDQTNLMLQVDLTSQLIPGSFEHAVNTIINSHVDTSIFDDQYHNDETGATAYDPKMLLKVVLFAYSKGILSSRKIEKACNENIIFMALSGDQHPDHSTIADFVSRQCRPIKEIFTQVLFLCAQMDLVGMEYLAVDGCKISSNAAKEHSGTHAELKKKKKKLQRKVDKLLTRHTANDTSVKEKVDNDPVEKLNRSIDRIEEFLETHSPRMGTSDRSGEVKSNITDNESAKLKSSNGFIQGYNGLAVVDAKHQVVLDTVAVGQNNEADLLPEILDNLPATLEAASVEKELSDTTLLADTAYHTAENLKELEAKDIDAVIPDNKFRSRDERFEQRVEDRREQKGGKIKSEDFTYDAAADEYRCPQGKTLRFHADQKNGERERSVYRSDPDSCTGCPRAGDCFRGKPKGRRQLTVTSTSEGLRLMKEMRDRIDSEEGRSIYSKRMGIVEPVFANIKACKGMNYFTLRGEKKVNIQWTLFALVHNIEKMLTTGAIAKLA